MQGLTINVPGVSAPVTIGAESDEIVILMRLTFRPRDNMMNIDLDISASGDGTPMARLDENASAQVGRYWRAPVSHCTHGLTGCDARGTKPTDR